MAKLTDKKHEKILSEQQKKELARLRDAKQVGNFKMPEALEPQRGRGKGKGKGRGSGDWRIWRPCPLLPGVPTVPPPHIPQPWELQRFGIDITVEQDEDIIEGTPPGRISPPRHVTDVTEEQDEDIIEGTPPGRISPPRHVTDVTEEQDEDIIEGTPPGRISPPRHVTDVTVDEEMRPLLLKAVPTVGTPSQAKKRKIQFSPSTGIVQNIGLPQNIVPAEIELLGFTPSTSGIRTAPGSGRSNYSMDIDIEMERDFIEPGEGSEVDEDDFAGMIDISLKPRQIDDYPMDLDGIAEHDEVEVIQELDNAADEVLRNVVGPEVDLLDFDWRGDPENFESVREAFTVPSTGPTFDYADLTPLDVFFKIWDADIIAYNVRETNRYGALLTRLTIPSKPNSRLTRWKDVTSDEILRFLAVLMFQSLVVDSVEKEYWYPVIEELKIGNFKEIMSYLTVLSLSNVVSIS